MLRRTILKLLSGAVSYFVMMPQLTIAEVHQKIRNEKVALFHSDCFFNNRDCEDKIIDKVEDIAKGILNEYGWGDHPDKEHMARWMAVEAKWEPDMVSTREVMLKTFMRERNSFDAGRISEDYYKQLKEHNYQLAMQKING